MITRAASPRLARRWRRRWSCPGAFFACASSRPTRRTKHRDCSEVASATAAAPTPSAGWARVPARARRRRRRGRGGGGGRGGGETNDGRRRFSGFSGFSGPDSRRARGRVARLAAAPGRERGGGGGGGGDEASEDDARGPGEGRKVLLEKENETERGRRGGPPVARDGGDQRARRGSGEERDAVRVAPARASPGLERRALRGRRAARGGRFRRGGESRVTRLFFAEKKNSRARSTRTTQALLGLKPKRFARVSLPLPGLHSPGATGKPRGVRFPRT